LNVLAENLDALKCGGWGLFIAPTTKVAVGEGCCRRAHQTVRCASHVTQPLGFDRWSSDMWGHRIVRWCTGQSLFTVRCTFWRLLWLCARSPHCSLFTVAFADDRWRCSRYFAWHTGQSGATPDSLVLHRTVRWIIAEAISRSPKVARSELISLAHRTLSGAPNQGSLRFSLVLFIWTISWTFYWFVLNLWYL
jgi:hypothetical protein